MYKFLLLCFVLVCSGCGMFGPRKLDDKEFIKVVTKAGCVLKTVTRDDQVVDSIVCQDTVVRHIQ